MSVALAVAVALVATACTRGGAPAGGEPSPGETGLETPDASGPAVGEKPIVDPEDIISGGPGPDGIPPIDDPKFVSARAAGFLEPQEPVLAAEIDGDARAYPLQVLTWHEIVNDELGGTPVSITYCPLCNTGVGFIRPVVNGELLDFGTSGKLYNSNLVMWDRQTESYWAQATGQAIMGPLLGMQLEFVPVQILSFGDWKAVFPSGKVLSNETGAGRPYGSNPYVGYDEAERPFLFDKDPDPRLPALARVLGVAVGKEKTAFPYDELRSRSSGGSAAVQAEVGGEPVVVFWKAGTTSALDRSTIADSRDVGAVGAFSPVVKGKELVFEAGPGGIVDRKTGSRWSILGKAESGPLAGTQLDRVLSIDSFWFDWAAFHPDTAIFGK